ncbi:MAG: hypothetical protein WCJ35_23140 [Planctomycetota bacterium]
MVSMPFQGWVFVLLVGKRRTSQNSATACHRRRLVEAARQELLLPAIVQERANQEEKQSVIARPCPIK